MSTSGRAVKRTRGSTRKNKRFNPQIESEGAGGRGDAAGGERGRGLVRVARFRWWQRALKRLRTPVE